MKSVNNTVLIASVLLAALVTTPQVLSDGRHAEGMERGQMMGGMSGTDNGQMMNMDAMQNDMQDMSEMMNEAHDTKDINKLHELMQNHMAKMQNMMGNMNGMMSDKMPGNMNMEQRQDMMSRRMDMIQGMMEQMLKQQSMMMDSGK